MIKTFRRRIEKLRGNFHLPRLSIRIYLAVSYVLFVLVGLFGTGTYWFTQQEAAAEHALQTQLLERAHLLATLTGNETLPPNAFNQPAPLTAFNDNLRVIYFSTNLDPVRVSDLPLSPDEQSIATEVAGQTLAGQSVTRETINSGAKTLYAASPVYGSAQTVVGVICLVLPLNDFQSTMNDLRQQLVFFAAILTVVSLIFGFGLATIFNRPLAMAEDMTARVAGGDNSVRLPRSGPAEMISLADNLNHMAEELEKQSKMRTLVLSNVTHELSRPIGGLRLAVDSLLDGGLKDRRFAADILKDMQRTLMRMDTLIEDLALVSRPQPGYVNLQFDQIRIQPLMDEITSRFQPFAEARGVQLVVDEAEAPQTLVADEGRLNQIIGNLIDNAIKFSPEGGKVLVSVKECLGKRVEFSVQDEGPGIPTQDNPRIFEPFYQGNQGRKIRQGMGLGLSIVKQLVEAHHGQITLENLPTRGLLARVTLPEELNSTLD